MSRDKKEQEQPTRIGVRGLLARAVACGLLMTALLLLGISTWLWSLPAFDIERFLTAEGKANRLSLSQVVTDRQGRLLRAFTAVDGRWRLPLETKDVAPHYFSLLLNFEDKTFYKHNGIEPKAFVRAFWQLARNGRIISGGSTLTMQVARLLGGRRERSLSTKLWQIKTALSLEKRYSKSEILNLYLRLTPFGGNVEGVRAASLAYFGKEPKRLSLSEAATLVALPQSPEGRRPDRFPEQARVARNRVLKRAVQSGVITRDEYLYAIRQKMVDRRLALPVTAPHLADKLVREKADAGIIATSLSRPLQMKLERLARGHANRSGKGLSAAILVIDHRNGDVLAHVGAADFNDNSRFGPIDMTDRVRSPGSTLKPFIYGLGFDAGLAHPDMLIEDAPVRFGLYSPKNFNGKFAGTVTVRKALQQSLNIPAVKMLAALKPARFASRFRNAGFERDIPHNLAVALGGVGFTLQDLARAFLHIANPGAALELNYSAKPRRTSGQRVFKHRPLLSEKAAFYVTHILRGATPPKNAKPGALAYKTGTSYGYRDAWAIGYDGQHLAAVWIGRPDGSSASEITGIKSAGPLLFDVFQHISERRAPFSRPPEGVLFASGDELPPPLRYFDKEKRRLALQTRSLGASSAELKIAFPPPGAEFYMSKNQKRAVKRALPLALKAEGGKLPLTWLVNGKVLPSKAYRRQSFYELQTPGFVEFSVIDALGRTDRVEVRVR